MAFLAKLRLLSTRAAKHAFSKDDCRFAAVGSLQRALYGTVMLFESLKYDILWLYGGFQKLGALSRSSYSKDHNILGSILGPTVYGPHTYILSIGTIVLGIAKAATVLQASGTCH